MDGPPEKANGMGGRQVRVGPNTGDIFDHHCVEFEYKGGVRNFCQARQQPGTWEHVSDNIHGTKGSMTIGKGAWGSGAKRRFPTRPRQARDELLSAGTQRSVGQHPRRRAAPISKAITPPPAP